MKELMERCGALCRDIEGALGVNAVAMDVSDMPDLPACACAVSFCNRCKELPLHPHRYGLNEAHRWGGNYIYYCPLGLTFTAISVKDETGLLSGGIVAGPMVMGDPADLMLSADADLSEELACLPERTTAEVRHISELLRSAVRGILPAKAEEEPEYDHQKFLNAIYDVREKYAEEGEDFAYILAAERRLTGMITMHDRHGSQELLNELLGHIYFTHGGDLQKIKARVLELVVVLSRAAIAAGADVSEIFRFSTDYIREIDSFTAIDEVNFWLSGIMHRFISASFDYAEIKHADVVHKVMQYIRANWQNKLSLDELAKHVYLSRAYLSTVFKEETGISISSYINKVRVEHAERMLRETGMSLVEIAAHCRFEDQSYFSKVFRKYTGMSPKKYRDSQL